MKTFILLFPGDEVLCSLGTKVCGVLVKLLQKQRSIITITAVMRVSQRKICFFQDHTVTTKNITELARA